MKPRRRLIIALLVATIALPALASGAQPAAAASVNPVITDCLAHPGGLTGSYSVAQIRHALGVMSPETREYTSCPDVLNRALLAALGKGTASGSSSSGGSGSFLPTPVIIVLVVLVLAAVTFGALAIRRRQQETAPGTVAGQTRVRTADSGGDPDLSADGDPATADEPDAADEPRTAGDLND
jgi:hypothetical protein